MLTQGTYLADRYEILSKIGAGGMSDVYKAKDHVLGRFVAIKVLKTEFSEDVNFVSKFRTEAQSAAGLEHPNIVNIYDVGSDSNIHYIVMENVEGVTLKTYIEKKGQLNPKEALSIAIQVGRGIEAAHKKNIIHRDIKPQNIMISTDGKVKVTDFGIARAASVNTINSDVMGSVHYSSPEQTRNGFVDGKSDIYSLGIVMYEMVTGRVPFDGDSTVAIAIQHLQEEIVNPSVYAPELPVSLEKIILKCTQKSPDRRYENMTDLLADLKKALTSPNEDFVVMATPAGDKTRVISDDEMKEINDTGVKHEERVPETHKHKDAEDEEESEGLLNPKMEKAVTILGIVAGIVIVLVVVLIILNFLGVLKIGGSNDTEDEVVSVSDEVEDNIEMITLTGMTFEEASEALEELGLSIVDGGLESSEDVDEGLICYQSEEAGDMVAAGSSITVKISSGPGEIECPDVVGKSETEAISLLNDAGLKYERSYESSTTVESGYVISQSPQQGESVAEGDTITIVVSSGVEAVKVPDLTGKTESKAQKALEELGLKLGSVNEEYSDTVEAGKVISQDVSSGKYVDAGTSVGITVSLGAKEVTYKFSTRITAPDNDDVESANIQLLDNDGNVIDEWTNVGISQFGGQGYSISVSGITGTDGTGTVLIEWELSDGSVSTQSADVTFTKE